MMLRKIVENDPSVLRKICIEIENKRKYTLSEKNALKQRMRLVEVSEAILTNCHPVVSKNYRNLIEYYLFSQDWSVEELLVLANRVNNSDFDTILGELEGV